MNNKKKFYTLNFLVLTFFTTYFLTVSLFAKVFIPHEVLILGGTPTKNSEFISFYPYIGGNTFRALAVFL